MAGIFGHEVENQAMSRKLFDLTWRSLIEAAATSSSARVAATGYSCRSQVKRFATDPAAEAVHPVSLLI
jgi:Fe-S oxidoreductase